MRDVRASRGGPKQKPVYEAEKLRDIIVFALVFCSLPFIFRRPYIGILVWSWLAYMNPHRLTWGIAYTFPFSMVVGITMIVAVAISPEPKRIPWTPVTIAWLFFFLWTALTTQFALAPYGAAIEWSRWWKICLISVFTLMIMGARQRLELLVWVVSLSLGFYGVKGGIFALFTGSGFMIYGPPNSFVSDTTSLALALIMVFPLTWYLYLEARNRWIKSGLLAAMLLISEGFARSRCSAIAPVLDGIVSAT